MRTTLDVDDDVLLVVKHRARAQHLSLGTVLSALAREALTAERPDSTESFLGFRPLQKRTGVVVTSEIVDRLRDDEAV